MKISNRCIECFFNKPRRVSAERHDHVRQLLHTHAVGLQVEYQENNLVNIKEILPTLLAVKNSR